MPKRGKGVNQRIVASSPPRPPPVTHHQSLTLTQTSEFNFRILPSPQELADYETLIEGAADRILTAFEHQSEHRMTQEDRVIGSDIRLAYAGVTCAFIIAMSLLGLAGWLVWQGHNVEGTILGTFDVTAIVGTFIYGTRSRRREREMKTAVMAQEAR